MKKNVWILNHYSGLTFFDKGGRHYNFAKYLKQAGYEPVVFCCNAKHGAPETYFNTDKLWEEHEAAEIGVPFVFVKARVYSGNGRQRVLNMVDFYGNVQKAAREYAKIHGKPDIILASSVHPLTLVAGEKLSKRFGVKCICEVRDLWPESLVAYSDKLKKSNPLVKMLYRGEKHIYTKADAVIFTMEGAYDYIIERGWEKDVPREKVFYINNGVDLEAFDYNREHFKLDDPDLENPDSFKVVYTGSLRPANAQIWALMDAIALMQTAGTYNDIEFLIYGKGELVPQLERFCADKKLTNVKLKGYVDKKYIPFILSKCDLNVLNCISAAVLKYGGSQNKLFEYLASGKPVLSGENPKYSVIAEYGCGISKEFASAAEIASAIEELKKRQIPYEHIRGTAELFDFKKLTQKLIEIIEGAL